MLHYHYTFQHSIKICPNCIVAGLPIYTETDSYSLYGSAIELKPFSGIHLQLKVFHFKAFINRITGKSFKINIAVSCR